MLHSLSPNPTNHISTDVSSDYFFDVMMDDELETGTRLDAAQTYGLLVNSAIVHGFLQSFRINKVYKKAIDKYHKINFLDKDYQFKYSQL